MTKRRQLRHVQTAVRVLEEDGRFHVWLCHGGRRLALAGAVGTSLAADAQRYGQDLVEELVDKALWMADRRAMTVSP